MAERRRPGSRRWQGRHWSSDGGRGAWRRGVRLRLCPCARRQRGERGMMARTGAGTMTGQVRRRRGRCAAAQRRPSRRHGRGTWLPYGALDAGGHQERGPGTMWPPARVHRTQANVVTDASTCACPSPVPDTSGHSTRRRWQCFLEMDSFAPVETFCRAARDNHLIVPRPPEAPPKGPRRAYTSSTPARCHRTYAGIASSPDNCPGGECNDDAAGSDAMEFTEVPGRIANTPHTSHSILIARTLQRLFEIHMRVVVSSRDTNSKCICVVSQQLSCTVHGIGKNRCPWQKRRVIRSSPHTQRAAPYGRVVPRAQTRYGR